MATKKHSIRVLHAAVALALAHASLGAAHAQVQSPETDTKLAQASDTKLAQAATTATDARAEAAKGEQIVVTARRREELIQDVPGAVTAFSSAQIEKSGMPDLSAIADLVPSTTLKASRATNSTLTAFIRGIGQQDPVAGYEQGVGIYLDDVYLARPQGALTDIYDLDRIEVLRGPQGTLYGRNTIGGAVKYVTRKLPGAAELTLKGTVGSFNERDFLIKGSVPIADTLRIGGAFATFNRDGFGTNVVNGKENYNKEVLAGRLSAEFTPTSSLFVRFAIDRTVDDTLPRQGHRLTAGPAPGSEPVLSGPYDTRANLYTVLGHDQEVKSGGESLVVEYHLTPELSFKSITAARRSKSYAPIDFDSLPTPLFEAPAIYEDDQKSQEFQFTYTGSKWQGVAGAYFMKANAFNEFDVLFNSAGGLSLYTLDDVDTRTWAAFADASYSLTNTLNLSIGGRYTSDHREARIFKRNYLGLTGSPTLGNPAAVGLATNTDMQKSDLNRTDTKFTPKIGLGWKFVPEHNLYVTYAEGFKGGFFDPRMDLGGAPNSATSLAKRAGVEPEEVKTLELGLKSSMNGGRLQTNADIFFTDYKNVQIPGSIPTFDAAGNVTGFAGNVTNAGKAKIKGVEFEGIARVSDQFTLAGMASFIDAEYKEWIVANGLTGASAALVNIAAGMEFQNTPRRTFSITGTYDWPLSFMGRGGTLSLASTYSYKSKLYQFEPARLTGVAALDVNVPANNLLAQDGYGLWDASLNWTSADRRWLVSLVGRNLTDKRYKIGGYTFGAFFNTVTAFYGDPRIVKLSASYRF
jgi:iron complex outermembrane receptor protein